MEIQTSQNISVICADLCGDLKHELQNIRDLKKSLALVLSFNNEYEFAKENEFDEQLIDIIETFPIPIITIIKDSAKEFVFEIVLASHLCIASDSAEFEINSIENLEKQIGAKNAEKLKFVGNIINAEKALDLGFINKVVPQKEIEKEALEMAEKIANLAPIAIQYCLKAVNKGVKMNLENGLKLETELFAQIFATEDMKEGTRAFLEKRKPKFQGK